MTTQNASPLTLWEAYRMRWKRRRLLWRSFRSRHQLLSVINQTASIKSDDILLFATMRNESQLLPEFFEHYRALGVSHFLIVENDSDDGTADFLKRQPDVSLWHTPSSYRKSRFGVDWLTWLQMRYGHGHWCLTVDADEFLVYSGCEAKRLKDLCATLDQEGRFVFGALMLDLYPKGPIGSVSLRDEVWFDAGPFRAVRQHPAQNLWLQGGARERVFFSDNHERSPTLNKIPLVKWDKRYAYMNSTHSALPPKLNLGYDGPGDPRPSGVLLHRKFEENIVLRSRLERKRGEHFGSPDNFFDYYTAIENAPEMWWEQSYRYSNPDQLVELGLMSQINW